MVGCRFASSMSIWPWFEESTAERATVCCSRGGKLYRSHAARDPRLRSLAGCGSGYGLLVELVYVKTTPGFC